MVDNDLVHLKLSHVVGQIFDDVASCGNIEIQMNTIGLGELKKRLSECVSRVKAGQALVVTGCGQPVAELRPISAMDHKRLPKLSLGSSAERLAKARKAQQSRLYPLMTRVGRHPGAELLDEERGRR